MKRHSKLSDKRPSNSSNGFIYISKTGESTNFLKEIISEKKKKQNVKQQSLSYEEIGIQRFYISDLEYPIT